MYLRPQYQHIIKRLTEPRKFIQVLLGPRQVGKTTLILQVIKDIDTTSVYITADDIKEDGNTWIEQQWETARIKQKLQPDKETILVIDEIQKIKNWSETVKKCWDKDTREGVPIKLVLLGSAQLILHKGLTESLAGRFEKHQIGHWSFDEMQKAFGYSPEQYAWFGGYPGAAPLIYDEKRWKAYVSDSLIETTISKDILMLSRIDKPALLKKLFEMGCLYSGQILSFTKLLGQLQDAGNTVTLSHYLQLLDNAGMLTGIEKYSGATVKIRSSSPKFQVQNTAYISALSGKTFENSIAEPDYWGRIVESAVGAHLVDYTKKSDVNLYYWREGNEEVDFVIMKGDKIIAIEVKSGSKEKRKGLQLFSKLYKPHKLLLIGNSGITWQEFLKIDIEQLF